MNYRISHVTRFKYSSPVSESVTEVRMQPLTDAVQHCLSFDLKPSPRARVFSYRDHLGNIVHHFDVARHHTMLVIAANSLVEVDAPAGASVENGRSVSWEELESALASGDFFDMLAPSRFAQPTRLLHEFADELKLGRGADPLTTLRRISTAIFRSFEYQPQSTRVDSPIDDALRSKRGVCQDFTHIMIALARGLGIPCRYVSGYLFHRVEDHDRSEPDASHAWCEAWLPGLGWTGFDPTNNIPAGLRHIRVAVGRDYADVPPTRGVYKGEATAELSVAVSVTLADETANAADLERIMNWNQFDLSPETEAEALLTHQQQQQQQQ